MISHKKTFFISFLILIVFCNFKSSDTTNQLNLIVNPQVKLLQEQEKDFSKINTLSLYGAINEYGMPLKEATFPLNDNEVNEFRLELKKFIESKRVLPNTKIKEITWKFKTDSLITVWYDHNKTNWEYICDIKYHK